MLTFPELLDYWAARRPQEEAVVCGATRFCWREFRAQVHAVAAALRRIGVRPGERVGLLLDNSAEWAVIYAAIPAAGGIIVPLNPRFGAFELRGIEADAACAALVSVAPACAMLADRFDCAGAEAGIVLAPRLGAGHAPLSYARAISAGGAPLNAAASPADVLGIFYTSGTTGLPKGTMQTHASVLAGITGQMLAMRLNSADRGLILAPLAFTGACLSALTPMLMTGGCAVIEPAYNPARMLEVIEAEKITYITAVPAIWERLPALPGFAAADLSGLRLGCTGGAPVPPALLQQFRVKGVALRQVYGATEAGGLISVPTEAAALATPTAAGLPLATIQLRVMTPEAEPCAPGEVGEICVRGPQVMRGYWRNPQATEAAFRDGWYRTGDLGAVDATGCITVTDRLKNMIISGGVNIYPAEIERAMAAIEAVEEVAVFGAADATWGQRAVALVYSSRALDIEAVHQEARRLLGAMKAPRDIVQCREPLPRTVTNKIARHNLQSLYHAQTAQNQTGGAA